MKPSYDLFSPLFKSDPFETFAAMRRDEPVYAHHSPNGKTIWYVTRYEDVVVILKDNVHFCKDAANAADFEQTSRPKRAAVQHAINRNMLFADPPEHTRLRALVTKAFTPSRIERTRPRVQAIADALLDKVMTQGKMDLIEAFALPLPVIVICDMLGIPEPDQAQVSELSQSIISPGAKGLSYRQRRRMMKDFITYLRELFEQRRKMPLDDLITALVEAEESGERLSESELSSMVALLLVTGHETTVNLIGNGLLALLQHPEQVTMVMKRGNAGWQTAVSELLRYDGPVETSTTRWVRRDIEMDGQLMQRGDIVRVVLSSANRDLPHCPHANELNLARADNRHLAFGLGIHFCLGAPLARLEGEIAFETLFRRFPTLRLAGSVAELKWRSGVLFRGLESLPLVW